MGTTAHAPPPAQPSVSPVLSGVSWDTYARLRRELDDSGDQVRITYDRGRMVLMSPLPVHEKWMQLIGRLVEVLAEEYGVPVSAFGSTTWTRQDLGRGLEADQCYYLQRAPQMRGKLDIDLAIDPPPDLAIEIDVSRHAVDRSSVYAALRVPEVWLYDGREMRVMQLNESGQYVDHAGECSAFPGFRPAEMHRFIQMFPDALDSEIAQAFRQWLRDR